jgi:hypothetical protein
VRSRTCGSQFPGRLVIALVQSDCSQRIWMRSTAMGECAAA